MELSAYKEWRRDIISNAIKKRAFLLGTFELTGRCNLDCKMCYVHNLDNKTMHSRELTTEQWKKIFDDAYAQGMMFATLSGGECLLRSDFKELYLHLWEKHVIVKVLTNATLLNDDYVEFFNKYKPEYIQVSLYGSCEEGYLQVTGHKGFERTMSAILALKNSGINIGVSVTPTKYLYDDYIPTIEVLKKNGIDALANTFILASNRDDPTKDDYYLTIDESLELAIKRAERKRKLVPCVDVPEPCGNSTEPILGSACTAGNCMAHVTWEGKMYPCVLVPLVGGFDVLQLGFAEAWNRLQAATTQLRRPIECNGCPYEKICVRCPISRSPKLDGHCDPQVCELTKRLVETGIKKLPKQSEKSKK